jgi:pyruvoyl-dependent arginine decarboxylase (PvlArgDC)
VIELTLKDVAIALVQLKGGVEYGYLAEAYDLGSAEQAQSVVEHAVRESARQEFGMHDSSDLTKEAKIKALETSRDIMERNGVFVSARHE